MEKLILTHLDCATAANHMAKQCGAAPCKIYGVPRGGIPVAYLLAGRISNSVVVENPLQAHVIVDDLIDSGATKLRMEAINPVATFLALADFMVLPDPCPWLVFPWENGADGDASADDIVLRLLQYIGEDPERGGLKDTPRRVLKAWKEWTAGYAGNPQEMLKCFEDGSENYDEMVVVKDLPFYSHCEHHLAPFFGTATIAYLPQKRIAGLSKLGRLLEMYARRLQVQERLTTQVADALFTALNPRGVGVMVKARHLCMESRGIGKQGHHTVTTALRGNFLSDEKVRAEFMAIARE